MNSVRVRRHRNRPYTAIQEVQDQINQGPAGDGADPVNGVAIADQLHPTSPNTQSQQASTGRPRGSTLSAITSFFSATSQPASPVDENPSSRQVSPNRSFRRPVSPGTLQNAERRRQNLSVPIGDLDPERPTSWVAEHIYQQMPLRTKKSDALLSASPPQTDRRSISTHGDGAPVVDMVISQDDLHGRVGSALSSPSPAPRRFPFMDDDDLSEEEELNEEDHHRYEIVEHLDVIDPQVAAATHLSNAANSIVLPPMDFFSRRPVVTLMPVAEDGIGEKGPKDELDRHVENVLTRRQKIKRGLHGFWDFVRTPAGFITALYGFLCGFCGAAIVVFLIRIINLHNSDLQNFWVEVWSQATNGLFTATGIGLIPWRAIDTYRITIIWYYKRLSHKLRKEAGLPPLVDEDDLPDPMYDPNFVQVLSDGQQKWLHVQQQRFLKSQTWYRPHATATHKAFPINTALWICICIDLNSVFQIFLCGTMWGLDRFERPPWTTGVLIPGGFLSGIAAAVLIWRGAAKTKKTKEVEERLRDALQMQADQAKEYGVSHPIDTAPNPPKQKHGKGPKPSHLSANGGQVGSSATPSERTTT